eukprot:GHVT01097077.1.p1 GENE.GHVT01097077.1~~GHVT01097077.1.p1  ORF type:complete len:439 (+),score=43.30 GHVT01097077.1:342-1658(+)
MTDRKVSMQEPGPGSLPGPKSMSDEAPSSSTLGNSGRMQQPVGSVKKPNRSTSPHDGLRAYRIEEDDREKHSMMAKEARAFGGVQLALERYSDIALQELKRQIIPYRRAIQEENELLLPRVRDGTWEREVENAILCNQHFLDVLLLSSDDAEMPLPKTNLSPDGSHDTQQPATVTPKELQKHFEMVRVMLRLFARDWSIQGQRERQATYEPLLSALRQHVPITDPDKPPKVLVPGCGLGRLPFEAFRLGYTCEGNDNSFFMLIGSSFILNHHVPLSSIAIYPNSLDFEHRRDVSAGLQPIYIPDICPTTAPHMSPSAGRNEFSMACGDFSQVYLRSDEPRIFDAILTSFFIDTSPNIIDYFMTIATALGNGGLWANIGPLVYHFAGTNQPGGALELSWEESRQSTETTQTAQTSRRHNKRLLNDYEFTSLKRPRNFQV